MHLGVVVSNGYNCLNLCERLCLWRLHFVPTERVLYRQTTVGLQLGSNIDSNLISESNLIIDLILILIPIILMGNLR